MTEEYEAVQCPECKRWHSIEGWPLYVCDDCQAAIDCKILDALENSNKEITI